MRTFTGRCTRLHDRGDVVLAAQTGRVENIGAGILERLEAPDGVVEIGAAVKIIFRARGERERKWQRPGRGDRRSDTIDGRSMS